MSKNKKKDNTHQIGTIIICLIILFVISYINNYNTDNANTVSDSNVITNFSIEDIPEYTNEIAIELNNNKPYFNENEYTTEPFENYSELDKQKRCGVAYANICKEIMPAKNTERGEISSIIPTGWEQTKVDGGYLYNRCHLIGYQLAGENANKLNLITGTRYFNVSGMLPFENEVATYINKNEKNHVLYRVTPIFKGENLLASGVEIEAYSVEDNGSGVCFNVYIYNVQPGVEIDYATGKILTR